MINQLVACVADLDKKVLMYSQGYSDFYTYLTHQSCKGMQTLKTDEVRVLYIYIYIYICECVLKIKLYYFFLMFRLCPTSIFPFVQ